MRGDEHQRGRRAAMGQRNLRCGRRAQGGSHARHDLVGNSGSPESFDFFAGAAEDQRVAALQANDVQPGVRESDHQKIDFFLLNLLLAATLANVVHLRRRRNELQNLRSDQVVVQHGFGRLAAGAALSP